MTWIEQFSANSWVGTQKPVPNSSVGFESTWKAKLKKVSSLFVLLAILAIIAAYPGKSGAQVLYGTLTGVITDPAGAAIPGAAVTVKEMNTGVERATTTNGDGLYLISNLNPGVYQVSASALGFAPIRQEAITLYPNTTLRVSLQLQVGLATEEVTVSASAAPELQTESAETSANISKEQIAELPTTSSNGRNVEALFKLVPGSTPPAEQSSVASNPQRAQAFNVNGISNATNTTRIDGAYDVYPTLPYLAAYLPPPDAIESVNVVTGSFNAEQGAAGGSAVNMTIKSGTSKFHGSAWEYNSIAQFNAQAWNNNTGIRQKNVYNDVGGTLGGPILKKNLFFFFAYDRLSIIKSVNGVLSVPTVAMRSGNFAGTGVTIYDPASGTSAGKGKTAFSNNSIPSDRIASAASILLQNLPIPNHGAAGALANNYFGAADNNYERQSYDAKVTYSATDKSSYFGHYSASPTSNDDPPVFGTIPGGTTWDAGKSAPQPGIAKGLLQNVGLGFTHSFTAHFATDWNAGYTRLGLSANPPDLSLGDYGTKVLQIPGTNNNGSPNYRGIPAFNLTTFASLGNISGSSPFFYRDNQYTGNANATWVHGNHSIRFGGEYLHSSLNHFQMGNYQITPRGSFTFSGGATAPSGGSLTAVNSFADFLLGQAYNYAKGVLTFNPDPLRISTFSFYAQDTWQASSKLTLNYGIRYEYYPLPVGDHFGTVRYDPSMLSTLTTSGGTNYTVGTVLIGGKNGIDYHASTNNGHGTFVPRLGVAFHPDDKMVVRAGFGITVDPDTLRALQNAYPSNVTTSINGANGYVPATSLNAGLQSPVAQVGIPALVTPDISSGSLPLPNNVSTSTMSKNFRRGYIESYNLSIQRSLGASFTSSVAYVGSEAVRQMSAVNINAAPPGGGTLGRQLNTTYSPGITNLNQINSNTDQSSITPFRGSNYNALQAQLTRMSAHRGSTGVIYTYSKTIDSSDNGASGSLLFNCPTYWNLNRALAGYDRKHNFQWWTIYNIPFGKGQQFLTNGMLGKVLGGWNVTTALSRVSGTPMTVTASSGYLNAPGNTQVADRNYNVNPILNQNNNGARTYLNIAAFSDVTASTASTPRFGTAGRNSVRGPGLFNLDASLKRSFQIWESVNLAFVAEAFDVTNTPQFANPSLAINSPASFGVLTTSNVDRTMRLSAHISF